MKVPQVIIKSPVSWQLKNCIAIKYLRRLKVVRGLIYHSILLFLALYSSQIYAQQIPKLNWVERPDWINIKTFSSLNAVGDGDHDDTKAIQNAIDQLSIDDPNPNKRKSAVFLPAGTYVLTQTLELRGKIGVSIIGCGSDTKIVWKGVKGGVMFRSDGNNYSRIMGIRWDGNKVASVGVLHSNKERNKFETRIRHEHESFKNLEYGILGMLPAKNEKFGGAATAETMVFNCKFEDVNFPISLNDFNYYNWIIDGCVFLRSRIAVNAPYGSFFARNSRFENSSESDFLLGVYPNGYTIRRCYSINSSQFIKNRSAFYLPSILVVENCYIKNWREAAAIHLTARGPSFVVDCTFEKKEMQSRPLHVLKPIGQGYNIASKEGKIHRLILSGNKVNGQLNNNIINNFGRNESVDFSTIPPGSVNPLALDSQNVLFQSQIPLYLSQPSSHVINVLDEVPAFFDPEKEDISSYAQCAINKAKKLGKGTIVYFPVGRYCLKRTLHVSGSDYVFQGSGFNTEILWKGDPNTPAIIIKNANRVVLEQFRMNYVKVPRTSLIHHSNFSKGKSLVVYDGLYHNHDPNAAKKNLNVTDIIFDGLSESSFVYMKHIEMSFHIKNCSESLFLIDNFINYYQTVLKISGDCKNRTRWCNMLTSIVIASSSSPEILVEDNNSLTITDLYNESGKNHIYLFGKKSKSYGRVTIQGIKQDFLINQQYDTILLSEGYNGELFYGPQNFYNNVADPKIILKTGKLTLLLAGISNNDRMPSISIGQGKIYFQKSIRNIKQNDRDQIIVDSPMNKKQYEIYKNAFDDIRKVGILDVSVKYGNLLQKYFR